MTGSNLQAMGPLLLLLMCSAACKSSSGEPIDPEVQALATDYCETCCRPDAPEGEPGSTCVNSQESCENLITETLIIVCPDETQVYYDCLTQNSCSSTACEAEWTAREDCMNQPAQAAVRERIAALGPSASLGHRGTGPTRQGHPFPENSIPAFVAAVEGGADGVELDVVITKDHRIVVMHDNTLDRTTDCTGCVSAMRFDEVRACRLLDGYGMPTDEPPPTLREVYDALGPGALINVELKVFGPACATATTGPEALVEAVLEEVTDIGAESRTLFSSFDETAVGLLKMYRPDFYSALITREADEVVVERALELNQDAIHPFLDVDAETVRSARAAGLQVNVWTAKTSEATHEQVEKGATAIITDDPAALSDLVR